MRNSVLIIAFILITSSLSAQNNVTIYGNVGVENVNISVLNTEYGTSSDNKGNYKLSLYESVDDIKLLYTCVGYRDSTVTIKPEMFQFDSIEVSFKMKSIDYELPAAGITATKDFYRSRQNSILVDVSFINDKILVLENLKDKTEIIVLDGEGREIAKTKYDSIYNEIFIDCFGNHILVGDNSCLQIYLNENNRVKPVAMFSKQVFKEKLQNGIFEFNDAYIFKNQTFEKYDYYVHEDHKQSQAYFYIQKQDSLHEKHLIVKFFNVEAMKTCQSYLSEIISKYYVAVDPAENEIALGFWDGNLIKLAETPKLVELIGWYSNIMAVELQTTVVKSDTSAYFIDLDRYRIVEIDTGFNIKNRYPLKILSGEKQFKNQFVTDNATGKSYGLFLKDGIYYIGLFDAAQGSVNMTTRASNYLYPKVLKINDGYAYGAYFDVEKQRSFINRVKID